MSIGSLTLQESHRFTKLILDFVSENPKLQSFYGLSHQKENYLKQIEQRKAIPVNRNLLADSLLGQYGTIEKIDDSVLRNVESLRKENCFTVTTGHQLNIFTGPLYFVYKILHTIKLADELNATYPEFEFVPIYWMNSEDHDIDEVGQFKLFGHKYVWETNQTGATGRMKPNDLAQFCEILNDVFSNNEAVKEIVEVFKKAYASFDNLADATRYFTNELFGVKGLVIIDSDDAALKSSFAATVKSDVLEHKPYKVVSSTNDKLVASDYSTQVNPREINSFYLENDIRNRIVKTDSDYRVLNTEIRFTEEELIKEIDSHPERFSPNVVLRPLFQEFILPNLTYVGGAGELSYWLQYKAYFAQFGVSFPMLCLRNHFLILNQNQVNRLQESKLTAQDLFGGIDDVVKKYVLNSSNAEVEIEEELELSEKLFENLKTKAEFIDASLIASVESEQVRFEKALNNWKGRFTRSLKQQNEVSVKRLKKLHSKLFPEGYLQERYTNFLEVYAQNPEQFFEILYREIRPFETEFLIAEV